jgi:hypothetical protein
MKNWHQKKGEKNAQRKVTAQMLPNLKRLKEGLAGLLNQRHYKI